MSLLDISNFDADWDFRNSSWASSFASAGITAVIIGTQWTGKAREQADSLLRVGIKLRGFYLESAGSTQGLLDTISLCQEYDVRNIMLVVEPGGLQTTSDLRIAVNKSLTNKLQPYIYGNESDLKSVIGTNNKEFSKTTKLWLANYGADDPANPRPPLTQVDICGWTVPSIHQYSSTITVAGRPRDHNYDLEEVDMTADEVNELIDKKIADALYSSKLIDSGQVPELVAQIVGSRDSGYTSEEDKAVIAEVRAKLFPAPPAPKTTAPSVAKDAN